MSEDVERHVLDCSRCRDLLREIRSENDLLSSALFAESRSTGPRDSSTQVVEGYEILNEIHRGGQGVVYKARQVATNRSVAIKMMLQGRLATSRQRHRFTREGELVAGLRHPGIVTLYKRLMAMRGGSK